MFSDILLLSLWSAVALGAVVPHGRPRPSGHTQPRQEGFPPDLVTPDGKVNQLPLNFDIIDSQHAGHVEIGGSFWVNAFVHGSDGHDYYIAAHVMDYGSNIPGAKPVYRGAIMGITDPSFYVKVGPIISPGTKFYDENGNFHAIFDDFGMETTSNHDALQGIRAYSSIGDVEFDFTFNHTSPILLNAALGSYLVNGKTGYEWSLPRGATGGWLKKDGEVINIVPSHSQSWYDRQWGSLQDSFSWLAVNFPDPVPSWLDVSTACVWDWQDNVNGSKQFATVRSARTGRDSVIPVNVTVSTTNTYMSSDSGLVYPSEGAVVLGDIELFVTTPRPDQIFEPSEEGTGFPPQFSGYVEVVAKKKGERSVKGYGAVDFMKL
ncbi:hypothetical protein LTR17_023372 [Elasticomyces elasticus]|nr:hypothetical protein LTR17_023372 [Elasticomyces elasticus]